MLLLVIPGIIFAQDDERRSVESAVVELQRSGQRFNYEGSVDIPFDDRTPFVAFALKLFDVDQDIIQLELAQSEDGNSLTGYEVIEFEQHAPRTNEFKVTELVFLDKVVQTIHYRITSSSALVIPIEYHFFVPSKNYSMEDKELPHPSGRTGCNLSDYVTRTGWNCPSGQDFSDGDPTFTNVSHLVVHHSAGTNTSDNWPAVVLSIWNYHRFTNGWSDIGYNFLIDPNGVIYEGRGGNEGYTMDVLPAATCGSNSGTMAVCILGNFEEVQPTGYAIIELERLLAWKCMDRSIDPIGSSALNNYGVIDHIFGHRQGCSTLCPGGNLYAELPALRSDIIDDLLDMCDPDPEKIVYINHIIDDNNDGESNGDNDGIVEAGETIEVYLTLKNEGGEKAYNLVADISSTEILCLFHRFKSAVW